MRSRWGGCGWDFNKVLCHFNGRARKGKTFETINHRWLRRQPRILLSAEPELLSQPPKMWKSRKSEGKWKGNEESINRVDYADKYSWERGSDSLSCWPVEMDWRLKVGFDDGLAGVITFSPRKSLIFFCLLCELSPSYMLFKSFASVVIIQSIWGPTRLTPILSNASVCVT